MTIGTQVQVLGKNLFYRFPSVINVACRPPRVGHIGGPVTGIGPATDVEDDILLATVANGIGNPGVLLTLVKIQMAATAIIHLDEIKIPVTEVELTVLLLMAVKSDSYAPCIPVSRSASVVTRVTIDTSLQAQRVDIVHQGTHPVGEPFHIQAQVPVIATPLPVTVVDVDIAVARVLQSAPMHGIGLLTYKLLIDVQCKGVPGTPPHGGGALGCCRQGQ